MDISKYIVSGTVVYDCQNLDPDKRLIDQLHELDQDMIAVSYDNLRIDLGWYYLSEEGSFQMYVADHISDKIFSIDFRQVSYIPVLLRLCEDFVNTFNAAKKENNGVIRAE